MPIDYEQFENNLKITGGIEETKTEKVKCGGYNIVIGGAAEYAIGDTIMGAFDIHEAMDHVGKAINSRSAENVESYIKERYGLKGDYLDALRRTHDALNTDAASVDNTSGGYNFNLDERELKNAIIKKISLIPELPAILELPELNSVKELAESGNMPKYPPCNIRFNKVSKIYHDDKLTDHEKILNIEKLFYNHMVKVEEYYMEITKILYAILNTITQ